MGRQRGLGLEMKLAVILVSVFFAVGSATVHADEPQDLPPLWTRLTAASAEFPAQVDAIVFKDRVLQGEESFKVGRWVIRLGADATAFYDSSNICRPNCVTSLRLAITGLNCANTAVPLLAFCGMSLAYTPPDGVSPGLLACSVYAASTAPTWLRIQYTWQPPGGEMFTVPCPQDLKFRADSQP